MINKFDDVAIIGGGSWGCALSIHLSRLLKKVDLVVRNKQAVSDILTNRIIQKYLREITLPSNVIPSSDIEIIKNKQLIIVALPSQELNKCLNKIIDNINPNAALLVATKGFASIPKADLVSNIIKSTTEINFAFISGPNFAIELIEEKLTAFTIASENLELAHKIQSTMQSNRFIGEITQDIITVQVAGAVKNIIAIYSGMMSAENDGQNAKAYLLTQGLNEIMQIAYALGSKGDAVFTSGVIGDLVLTCYPLSSRNMSFGYNFAKSSNKGQFLKEYPHLVEGRFSAALAGEIISRYKLNLPIIQNVIKALQLSS